MDALIQLVKECSPIEIIVAILLIIKSVEFIIDKVKNGSDILNIYYKKRNKEEKNDESIQDRLNRLESRDEDFAKALNNINYSLGKLDEKMNRLEDNQKKTTVASSRSTIYRVCNEVIEKKWMSQIEFEILDDLSKVYTSAGGNHFAKDVLLPKAMALPVISDLEIQQMTDEEREQLYQGTYNFSNR